MGHAILRIAQATAERCRPAKDGNAKACFEQQAEIIHRIYFVGVIHLKVVPAQETQAIETGGPCDWLMHLTSHSVLSRNFRALSRLLAAELRTAILSNGTPRMLEAAVNGAELGELIDNILSVEEVDVYKPHPKGLSARRGSALRTGA